MKSFSILLFCSLFFISCNDNEVVVTKSDTLIYKYICENGSDTLNSERYRFLNGILCSKTPLKNGVPEGEVVAYFPNGDASIRTNFNKGLVHGVNMVYNENGGWIRSSLYINNFQALYYDNMVKEDTTIGRKRVFGKLNGKVFWAGELYFYLRDSTSSDEIIQGMYVDVVMDDTIFVNEETQVKLDITFPEAAEGAKILIGEFDNSFNCFDTLQYVSFDTLPDYYSFYYTEQRPGNSNIVGRLMIPDEYLKEDIYFFKGFFVSVSNLE